MRQYDVADEHELFESVDFAVVVVFDYDHREYGDCCMVKIYIFGMIEEMVLVFNEFL